MYFRYAKEKNLQSFIVFWNVLKTFPFTKQCSLRSFKSLPASGAGFRSLGSLPFSEEPKRIRQKSLGSLPETESPKERAFIKSDLKSANSTVFGRRVPKEWDFIFYQFYRSQKMPKRIRPYSGYVTLHLAFFPICRILPSLHSARLFSSHLITSIRSKRVFAHLRYLW